MSSSASKTTDMRHWLISGLATSVFAIMATLGAPSSSRAAAFISSIALQGQTAPGTGGTTFVDFDEPFVSTGGAVSFGADLFDGRSGEFLFNAGVIAPIALTGQTIPGVGTITGTISVGLDGPAVNNAGTFVFSADGLTGGLTTAAVLQKTLSGSLTAILRQGDPVPGTAGGTFTTFDDLAQNNLGDVAVLASYVEGGVAKAGVFLRPSAGPVVSILLEGAALPGTGGGSACPNGDERNLDGPWINDAGVVAFTVDAICGGTGGLSGSLFVRSPAGPIEAFVILGDPAPPSIGGTITDVSIGRPGLNNADTIAFKAEFSGAGPCVGGFACAILTKTLSGTTQICAQGGAAAPGTTGTFDDFDGPALNQNGLISIGGATIVGDPAITEGVFTCAAGQVRAVALQGEHKPGTASTFGSDLSDTSLGDNASIVFIDATSPTGVFFSLTDRIFADGFDGS